ncbi:universal stress protein [Dyella solisilvae]|uniref:Universal stress protein n=1 Tax=Dyella solisilvae TaxID=1920168 RepID=A0A370K9R7_9GAMM|nr:universal stress protein [Dyella solisilvae]RDI99396.1 universal stress protein [Dyella solisilvae]
MRASTLGIHPCYTAYPVYSGPHRLRLPAFSRLRPQTSGSIRREVSVMFDVLAFCENHTRWPASLGYAARLAASFESRLTGIYTCPIPSVMLSPYEMPRLMAEQIEALRQLEQQAIDAAPSFEAFAQAHGATRASWQVAEEEVVRALQLAGCWHDVLVLGRTPHSPWGSASSVGSIVLGTDMPCIVVPDDDADATSLDCIAIAWNGSREAIGAVHAARHFLKRARKVTILHGQQRPPASLGPWRPPFDLTKYLADNGVASESVLLSESADAADDLLLEAANKAKADLLVMGAYGHTRISEWIFGGATRGVLENLNLPVFMRH